MVRAVTIFQLIRLDAARKRGSTLAVGVIISDRLENLRQICGMSR